MKMSLKMQLRICWLPLRFDGEMVYIDRKDSWSPDE